MLRRRTKSTAEVPTEQRLVEATLALIIQNGGCRGVNLRQIAARAGCAHTNAYNYFDSLNDLFWAALNHALELQIADTAARLQAPAATEAPLRTFLTSHVVFAQQNPGLYRLFWLEPLTGPPPPHVLKRLDDVRQQWVHYLGQRLTELRSTTNPVWAGQIIHGYFHGEICKLIGRHAFVPKSDDDQERIINNTLALVDLIATAKIPS